MTYTTNRKRKTFRTRQPMKRGKRSKIGALQFQKMINRSLAKNIETKTSNYSTTDGIQIGHNDFVLVTSNILKTTNGTSDTEQFNTGNRIGDKINIKGVSLKMMLELNERYSDVTFRILVVKSSRGDVPSTGTLFNGLSGNRMMDTLNHERYTVIAQKFVKMKAPGIQAEGGPGLPGEGNNTWGVDGSVSSRATRIVKMWLPGKKFSRNGVIQYENGGTDQKFFDYHVLCYAYSNYSTSEALGYNVGRINEYIHQMFFKDA